MRKLLPYPFYSIHHKLFLKFENTDVVTLKFLPVNGVCRHRHIYQFSPIFFKFKNYGKIEIKTENRMKIKISTLVDAESDSVK